MSCTMLDSVYRGGVLDNGVDGCCYCLCSGCNIQIQRKGQEFNVGKGKTNLSIAQPTCMI